MEPPGRCGDWLAPPPSPPRAHAPGRHDEGGVWTSTWPPAGTYTWPSTRIFPWPWTEGEPVQRESAWIGAAWTLVDAARAALVGQAVPTARGGAWTVTPARCPAGHPHRPGRVLAGWRPCRCGGHHTWTCIQLHPDGRECGAETVAPEPGPECREVRAW